MVRSFNIIGPRKALNMTDNLANKINDLRKLADERRGKDSALLKTSASAQHFEPPGSPDSPGPGTRGERSMKQVKPFTPNRRATPAVGMVERPASRMEIVSLEHELEDRVRLVLDMNSFVKKADNEFSDGYSFEPHRESMRIVRERMLAEFGVDSSKINLEPWLDSYVKCECLKVMCDDVSSKFADMLAIQSVELGSVLRKLRLTYRQCFEQMHSSWKTLRQSHLDHTADLSHSREAIKRLQTDLENKENEMHKKFDSEVNRLNAEFNAEKARDQEKLTQTEFKMDQMSDTLKYLNGIFRTMQSDGATIKTADLQSKCYRLEKENYLLQEQNSSLDSVNANLAKSELRVKQLEKESKQHADEIKRLNLQLERREDVIKQLMEKETLRNAEIEKLQKMSKLKDDELVAVDLKDSATSVLCIKCKKSLDDLSNIRSAILGDNSQAGRTAKMQCEAFRILLPNLKGRQPNRHSKWLRNCMRSILMCKLKEDVHLQFIKGNCTRFPAFVYAWFVRKSEGRSSGAQLVKLNAASDEDRWGLYYGVKALAKEDPEALVFWSLLDETYGEDGLQFVMYCLSVLLSIGGALLWKQFGSCMEHGANINVKSGDDDHVLDTIWVDIFTAKEAVKLILVRALAAHIADAVDAIDALKVRPTESELEALHAIMREEKHAPPKDDGETVDGEQSTVQAPASVPEEPESERDPAFESSVRNSSLNSSAEPTHINLFMWLRLMLQQIHADQIQRSAAVRLMFETASVGALTPQTDTPGGKGSTTSNGDAQGSGSHVEYPQFQSICVTLFPHVPVTEMAVLYANCYDAGQRKVNSEVFVKVADRQGLFAHALKLPQLPLLQQQSTHQRQLEGAKSQSGATVKHIRLDGSEEPEDSVHVEPVKKSISDMFSLKTEQAVRSKLATMVHRKLATVTPSINIMLKGMPERWQTLIEDAMEQVRVSLADSHQKLVTQVAEAVSHGFAKTSGYDRVTMDDNSSKRAYIDGIQPFVAYRRLILLCSLVKTICDNPLLPTELFAASDLDNNNLNIDHAMFRAEKMLTSLEQGFLLAPSGAGAKGNMYITLLDKYHSFETVRVRLIARRLQNVFRKFLSRDVVVPRSVRLCMSPGYLGMASFATATIETVAPISKYAAKSNAAMSGPGVGVSGKSGKIGSGVVTVTYEKLYLRNREVYHEPWWGQCLVAEIFRYKLTYDAKAASLGLAPISLAQAVTASQYVLWGTMELAETAVQDLFLCVKAYRLGVPRLRMFAAFLGDGRDLDEPVADMLKTPHALSAYLSLLLEVHRELHRERLVDLAHQHQLDALNSVGEDGAPQTASPVVAPLNGASGKMINVLFPSTDNATKRIDKREVWMCSTQVLVRVAKRWAATQRATGGAHNIYTDLPEKVRANGLEQIEVDDFLWIMMVQWAKIAAWQVKRSTKITSLIEKTYLSSKYTNTKVKSNSKMGSNILAAVKAGSYTRHKILVKKASYQNLPALPLSNLRTIAESPYLQGEGSYMADCDHFVSEFVRRVGLKRNILKLLAVPESASNTNFASAVTNIGGVANKFGASMFTQEMEQVMHESVLWDTNDLSDNYIRALKFLQSGLLDSTEGAAGGSVTGLDASSPDGSVKMEDSEGNPITNMAVLMGYNPEMAHVLVKAAFVAYVNPVRTFLEEYVEHLEALANPELESKYQTANNTFIILAELFQPLEFEYHSYSLYSHEADASALRLLDQDIRTTVIHTATVLSSTEATHAQKAFRGSIEQSANTWRMWQTLVSLIAELSIAAGVEMPHDTWSRGTKTHVDRAVVYNAITKSAP